VSNFGKPDKRIGGSGVSEYLARESAMRGGSVPGGSGARKGIGIPKKMNPKQVQAEKDGKVPYEYLVLSVLEDDAYVHKHGGDKYGKRNWTIDEIKASTYVGAMFRHYTAWAEGENLDPDSGRPHLTHLRACCAVVLDAIEHDKLIDDRLFAEALEPDAAILDETAPISKITYDEMEKLLSDDTEQWVVLETLVEEGSVAGNIRGYGTFNSKEAAQEYARIVHRASARMNFCSVMKVNDVKNIRSFR
jgi:hypothetical protein